MLKSLASLYVIEWRVLEKWSFCWREAQPLLLILATPLALEVLHQSLHWVCDGTFKYCPQSFYQMYSIHGFLTGEAAPLVIALMANKLEVHWLLTFMYCIKLYIILQVSYVWVLQIVREELETRFESVGAVGQLATLTLIWLPWTLLDRYSWSDHSWLSFSLHAGCAAKSGCWW